MHPATTILLGICVLSCAPRESRLPEPIRAVHAPDLPLEGRWRASWSRGSDATVLDITGADRWYEVAITRLQGQSFPRHLDTAGEWRDGALWLRGPEMLHARGDALYPVRFGGIDCLVPSGSLSELVRAVPWNAERELVFRRVPSEPRPARRESGEIREYLQYLPGPEDENKPARWRDVHDGG